MRPVNDLQKSGWGKNGGSTQKSGRGYGYGLMVYKTKTKEALKNNGELEAAPH